MKKPDAPNQNQYSEDANALYDALLSLGRREEVERFFKDLCTPTEIRAMAERWRVAALLKEEKLSYRDIRDKTGVSLATIGRVARFLTQEPHKGYALALDRKNEKKAI